MTIGAKAILAAALVGTLALTNAHAQSIDTRIGTLDFDHRLPTSDTRQKLYDELDFQRAVQGVLWAEPAINNARFLRANRGTLEMAAVEVILLVRISDDE